MKSTYLKYYTKRNLSTVYYAFVDPFGGWDCFIRLIARPRATKTNGQQFNVIIYIQEKY